MARTEATDAGRHIIDPDERLPRVLIVEDHELLAQSVGLALSNEGYAVAVSALGGMDEVVAEAERSRPDVVLLDLDLGGRVGDGVGLIQPLQRLGAAVLVVTAENDRARLGLCLEQGALGVLSKAVPFQDLLDSIGDATHGRSPTSDAIRHELLGALRAMRAEQTQRLAPFARLTPRERQILACLMEGLSAEAIAARWFVSEATVRTQIRGVLMKLAVSSQLAAVAEARRAGWEPEPE